MKEFLKTALLLSAFLLKFSFANSAPRKIETLIIGYGRHYCHDYLSFSPYEQSFRVDLDWGLYEKKLEEILQKYPQLFFKQTIHVSGYEDLIRIQTHPRPQPTKHMPRIKVLLTAGLHGNEPLSLATILEFLDHYARNTNLQNKLDLVVFPAVNIWGLKEFVRHDRYYNDLNRHFNEENSLALTKALMDSVKDERFDLVLDLHGAVGRKRHFVIRGSEDHGLARQALRSLKKEALLNSQEEAPRYDFISEGLVRSDNLKTMKDFGVDVLKVPYSYTLEYPRRFDPEETHRLNLRLVLSFIHHRAKIRR